MSLGTLPNELLLKIVQDFDASQRRSCRAVSRNFSQCASECIFDKGLFITIRDVPKDFRHVICILDTFHPAPTVQRVVFRLDSEQSTSTKGELVELEGVEGTARTWKYLSESRDLRIFNCSSGDDDAPFPQALLDLVRSSEFLRKLVVQWKGPPERLSDLFISTRDHMWCYLTEAEFRYVKLEGTALQNFLREAWRLQVLRLHGIKLLGSSESGDILDIIWQWFGQHRRSQYGVRNWMSDYPPKTRTKTWTISRNVECQCFCITQDAGRRRSGMISYPFHCVKSGPTNPVRIQVWLG